MSAAILEVFGLEDETSPLASVAPPVADRLAAVSDELGDPEAENALSSAATPIAARRAAIMEKVAAAPAARKVPSAAPRKAPAASPAAVSPAARKSPVVSPAGEKRKPGRPPSKPRAPPIVCKGIVDSPNDSANRLEFVYSEPLVFKSLFTYFKNIRARDIYLRCTRAGLTFFARDHSKMSRVVAFAAGQHANWHYCEDEYWLGINRPSVEKMFASIDKTFFKITITQTHEAPNSLTFVFKDAEVDKDCNYTITLSSYARDVDLFEAEKVLTPEGLKAFPIEFMLTAKLFRKSIGDANNYSETITFEKLGSEPLQLTYAKQSVSYHEVYRSPEKIKLRSEVAPGTAFRCTVAIANVKSLASSMVTDDVRILCRESGDILFRSAIDEKALVVSTLTKIS